MNGVICKVVGSVAFAAVIAASANAAADCGEDAFMIGASGFSKVVCNEKGVRELKDFGADFARCVKIGDRATLDLFEKYGLKVVVNGVVPGWWGGKTEWAGLMHEKRPLSAYANAREKYAPHPAILAVDIGDEPSKSDFAHYAKVVEHLNGELPGVAFTLNLFPSYGSHIARTPEERLKQLGTDSYEDYIRTFCEMFPTMKEVSFDFYPYSAPPAEVGAYLLRRLADFAIVSRACREYGRRIAFCLQANSLFKDLEMDLPRLRYQAFTALAFGTRTLIWECYTPSWWENNILEKDGSRTPRWERVRKVNGELHALTRDFARFRSIGTRLLGFSGEEIAALGDAQDVRWRDSTAVRKMSCAGRIVVGEFNAKDATGDTAVLVAAAWDPEGKSPGVKRFRFRAHGSVRVYGQNGEVMPERERDGKYALDLASDGAYFIVAGVPPPVSVLPLNPDDQQRRFGPATDETYQKMIDMGFNAFGGGNGYLRCDFSHDEPRWNESCADAMRSHMRRMEELGVAFLFSCGAGRDKALAARYPRIDINGNKVPGRASVYELDAAEPGAVKAFQGAARQIAKAVGNDPNFRYFRPCSEIRLRTTPSFTERNAAAYRADTGKAVPAEARGRAAPHWRTLKDIPANRVVSEHHPVLEFYRWFWQKGDGWNGFGDAAIEAFMDETGGRRLLTEYDPCLRTPALFGCGGDVEMVGQWIYSYNIDPVNVSYDIAHIAEVARGTPGQRTIVGLQCICHCSRIANKRHVKNGATIPDWYAKREELGKSNPGFEYYPSMPPDLMRIGLWSALSRQTDGISFHGWQCMLDPAVYGAKESKKKKKKGPALISGYQYTTDGLGPAMEDFFRDVAVPFGPLFKAVPEREPCVAVFDGWASGILSGTALMDWDRPYACGVVATAANFAPATLFEEDVEMNGVPESVKVLLMPEAEVITEGAFVRIRDFQRRGGRLVATEALAPALKADAQLPKFCAPPPPSRVTGAAELERSFRASISELKATLAAYVTPRVSSDTPYLYAHARGGAAYDLLFVVNDRRGPGDYVGVFDTVLDKGLPTDGTVALERDAKAVYDLVRHERAEFNVEGGKTSIRMSLGGAEGRLYLVCDHELGELSAETKARSGGIEVVVRSPDSDVMIPIKVVVGPDGKPFYGVVRDGEWRHAFSGATGAVNVTNLADGKTVCCK